MSAFAPVDIVVYLNEIVPLESVALKLTPTAAVSVYSSLYEIEFERKEALGKEGYREDYGIGPEGIKEESMFGDVDFDKVSGLLKGGSNDVLRGTQISAPRPPSVSPRGGRIGVTYPYKSVAEGSYQQGVAYDDLVDKLVKGLLSEQIRQLPYRGLI